MPFFGKESGPTFACVAQKIIKPLKLTARTRFASPGLPSLWLPTVPVDKGVHSV
jgi:hypothetical protein